MKGTPEEANQAHLMYLNHCRAEVEWYRRHGRYADRVRVSSAGVEFVVGDLSWNQKNPNRREYIEPDLSRFAHA